MMSQASPVHLDLKKDEKLEIHWADGHRCVYTVSYLRSMCPCALCKEVRQERAAPTTKPRLTILPGNYAEPISVMTAELVGNYAIRIDWSDQHGSGIYSFQYLRDICPKLFLDK
jgi:DUF971 family protein